MKFFSYLTLSFIFLMAAPLQPRFNQAHDKSYTIFGSMRIEKGIQELASFPVFFKGGEYKLKVQKEGEGKTADFELYDHEKPTQLYLIISDDFKRPAKNTVTHWQTKEGHAYRYYRLTRYSLIEETNAPQNSIKKPLSYHKDTWEIEELDSSKETIDIPDPAIIIFLPANMIDHLEATSWTSNNSSVKLPIIVLKNLRLDLLQEIIAKVSAIIPDFRMLYREPFKAYVPHTQKHILSMPFTPRNYC